MAWPCRIAVCLLVILQGTLLSASVQAKETWRFTVLVAVEKKTADYYQQLYAKDIETIVREQLATVSANFNRTDQFHGVFDFTATLVYVFDASFHQSVQTEIFKPHPGHDYKLVIDGFSTDQSGGGWYGSWATICHKWDWNSWGGPFGGYATDGLTHEFGHARGAIDIYALGVDAAKNLVNGTRFEPINSIMNYPYDNISWDEHTVHILNRTGGNRIPNEDYITKAFTPTLGLKTLDQKGRLLPNVHLELFAIPWFSYTVSPTPYLSENTNTTGVYSFPVNPFGPAEINYPWHIRYCNFLIKATYQGISAYHWMPLYEVQNAYFRDPAATHYFHEITLPLSLPDPVITITHLNKSSFCPGDSIEATFVVSGGDFEAGNLFRLELSDWGAGTNKRVLASAAATQCTSLKAKLPDDLSPGFSQIKVVSSRPVTESTPYTLNLVPRPAPPQVVPIEVCEGATAPLLEPVGADFRWYTDSVGGVSSGTPPALNTHIVGVSTYYVSQLLFGCESARASVAVTVNAIPEVPRVDSLGVVYCQNAPPQPLLAQGEELQWYLEAEGGTSLGSQVLPATDEVGTFAYYVGQRIRGCESGRSRLEITIKPLATAVLTGSQTVYAGEVATLSVAFTGHAPWTFSYRDSTDAGLGPELSLTASTSPYRWEVRPVQTASYFLTGVSNECGPQVPQGERVVVEVIPILGIKDRAFSPSLLAYPVPATSALTVRIQGWGGPATARLELLDALGRTQREQEMQGGEAILNLDEVPPGGYILRVRMGEQMLTKRIVKR
ncbi:hypothetical protein GCM10027275_50840 [Rhabdobacter roseus]|uniref:Ig-like domain-containing protein n=1 Tax=Rhabdobacter roseus TaxID=1655419 RepID=A0A840U056_9BACT|nr:T9SS type A sorting domain-containing protein [Rhabdobacter roseus]MBB5287157.1 hypothetical protein [Rhabdobacter roseus]